MSSTAPPARPGASFPSSGTPTSKKKSAGPSSWAALAKPAAPFAVAAPPAIPDPETAQQRHARALRKHLAADPDASAKRAQELAAIRAAWGGSTTKEAGRLGTNGSMKKRRCVVCTRPIEGASGGTCASCGGDAATGSSSDAEVEGVDKAAETLLSETTELVEIVSTPAVTVGAAWGGSTSKEAGRLGTNGSVKKRRCVVCTRPVEGPSSCTSCGGDAGSSSDAEVEGVVKAYARQTGRPPRSRSPASSGRSACSTPVVTPAASVKYVPPNHRNHGRT